METRLCGLAVERANVDHRDRLDFGCLAVFSEVTLTLVDAFEMDLRRSARSRAIRAPDSFGTTRDYVYLRRGDNRESLERD